MGQYGEDKLIDILRKKFIVSSEGITEAQKIIANLPWSGIYTTNYDNVIEEATGNQISPVVLSDKISSEAQKCVHLNGYIKNIDSRTIRNEVKLTSSSYDLSIIGSPWVERLRLEIQAASVIIFVGYSMADIDISRLLVASESIRKKCLFVDIPNLDPVSENELRRFGSICKVGVDKFADMITARRREYVPPQNASIALHAFKEYIHKISTENVTDDNFMDLIFKGVYDNTLAESQPYLLEREEMTSIIRILREGNLPIVHSDIANGKTLLVKSVCNALATECKIYFLKADADSLFNEFRYIIEQKNYVIIVENYNAHFDELKKLSTFFPKDIHLILTARSSAHDYFYEKLRSIIPDRLFVDCNCDKLDDNSIDWLSSSLDHYGLWGEYAANTSEWKKDFLSGAHGGKCNKQFHSILLYLLRSPEIRSRFAVIFDRISKNADNRRILNALAILELIFGGATIDDIETIFHPAILNADITRGDDPLKNFINLQTSTISLKSSALALFFLEQEDPAIILETLIKIHNAFSDSYRFGNKAIQLVRFANVNMVFTGIRNDDFINSYYASIKTHKCRREDPLFWLQYATACTEQGNYSAAEMYFATSRSWARKRFNFNTYQIDNREAIFLLKRAVDEHDFCTAVPMFLRAVKYVRDGFNNPWGTERIRKPFRPAALFYDFVMEYHDDIIENPKINDVLLKSVNNTLRHLDKLPRDVSEHPELVECKKKMLSITGAIKPTAKDTCLES